jgi:large subunit ribosomal protein L23
MSEPDKKEKATEKTSEKKADKKADKKAESAAPVARRFGMDRLMTVVLAPVVSEKSTFVADKNRQYVFRVADDATKPEIKAAVELMFKTKVHGVTVSNVKGKERRFGRTIGRKRSWKKAYVRLAEGQEINFAATE